MGLTLCVWHTNSNCTTLPVSSAAGKAKRMHLDGLSDKGERLTANGKNKETGKQPR